MKVGAVGVTGATGATDVALGFTLQTSFEPDRLHSKVLPACLMIWLCLRQIEPGLIGLVAVAMGVAIENNKTAADPRAKNLLATGLTPALSATLSPDCTQLIQIFFLKVEIRGV